MHEYKFNSMGSYLISFFFQSSASITGRSPSIRVADYYCINYTYKVVVHFNHCEMSLIYSLPYIRSITVVITAKQTVLANTNMNEQYAGNIYRTAYAAKILI